jgi:hypothetical protein
MAVYNTLENFCVMNGKLVSHCEFCGLFLVPREVWVALDLGQTRSAKLKLICRHDTRDLVIQPSKPPALPSFCYQLSPINGKSDLVLSIRLNASLSPVQSA